MPTQNYRDAPAWVQELLHGGGALGSSGFNLSNAMADYISGGSNGQLDPRLSQYGRYRDVGSEASHPEFFSDDPRVGPNGTIDGGQYTQLANDTGDFDWDRVIDPSQVVNDPRFGLMTAGGNIRDPHAKNQANAFAVMASMVAAPALYAAMSGATAGTGADSGSLSNMYSSSPPDSYWNMTADAGNVASDAGGASGGLGEYGGLDPETWAGNGGMGVSQNGLGSWNALPWQDRLAGLAANPGSALSSTGMPAQAAGQMGSGAMKDPRSAMQLANLVTQLGSSLSGNDSGGGDNGPTELGSMGWKPPKAGKHQPAKYDKRFGSPYAGWVEQYLASLKPLGGMYGHG